MANTREIRRRIKSIKSTAQITKAMQMVAASKMRKAQQAALAARPYADLLDRIRKSAARRVNLDAHPLIAPRPVRQVCVLGISTNRGLCGGLNTNLGRIVMEYDPSTTSFVTAGVKGRGFVTRTKRTLLADFEFSDVFTFGDARAISKYLIQLYLDKKVDRVDVVYTRYVNTLTQKAESFQLLPLAASAVAGGAPGSQPQVGAKPEDRSDYEYEPDAEEVLGAIIPHYVHYQIWHALLESKASEHSARMVAMKNATDNAAQLIKDLTLEYNKIRQSSITKELLEISTAQMAMSQ